MINKDIFSKLNFSSFLNQTGDNWRELSYNKNPSLRSHFKKVRKYYKGYSLLKDNKKEVLK